MVLVILPLLYWLFSAWNLIKIKAFLWEEGVNIFDNLDGVCCNGLPFCGILKIDMLIHLVIISTFSCYMYVYEQSTGFVHSFSKLQKNLAIEDISIHAYESFWTPPSPPTHPLITTEQPIMLSSHWWKVLMRVAFYARSPPSFNAPLPRNSWNWLTSYSIKQSLVLETS